MTKVIVLAKLMSLISSMKTVEQVIEEKAEREELKRLRILKRNLESGIVFDVSPELMEC